MRGAVIAVILLISSKLYAQDSLIAVYPDSTLRIINLSPFFSVHVDSTLQYHLQINRQGKHYYWYLKQSLPGLQLDKDQGILKFKADRSFFLSNKLRYDVPYPVHIGVQNLQDENDKFDTSFIIQFYNTEIIPSRLTTTVGNAVTIDEGEILSFVVFCEDGSFPVERILFHTSSVITDYKMVERCGETFSWRPDYDIVKESDAGKTKTVTLSFIGISKNQVRDTALVKITVRDALNYPLAVQEYELARKNMQDYILQLKYSFLLLDRKVKKVKNTRTAFDMGTAASSLTGTIMAASDKESTQKKGRIIPSIGLTLVPVKEAVAPAKTVEQNQASLVRSTIKRLEYVLFDNSLIGDKDQDITRKTAQLKQELKQAQLQLVDIPVDVDPQTSAQELDNYFNNRKVNKKYRLRR